MASKSLVETQFKKNQESTSFLKYSQITTMARVSSSQLVNKALISASAMLSSENCNLEYAAKAAPPLAIDSSFSNTSIESSELF